MVGWKALNIKGIRASQNPNAVEIGEIALAGLRANAEVAEDKTTNISRLVNAPAAAKTPVAVEPAPAAAQPVAPAKKWDIKVGDVVVTDGNVAIKDRSVAPAYKASLNAINGRVSGVSSISNTPARVELKALWDGYAPIDITGAIKPFKEDLRVDIALKFTNMDLSDQDPPMALLIVDHQGLRETVEQAKWELVSDQLIARFSAVPTGEHILAFLPR